MNEQWSDYWQALFARHGYKVIDCLRMRFWQNPAVAAHYAQNLLFFVDEAQIANYPALQQEQKDQTATVRRLVHPERYLQKADLSHFTFRQVLRVLPYFVRRFFRWHWHRWFGEAPQASQANEGPSPSCGR